jgi:hypothetical protein
MGRSPEERREMLRTRSAIVSLVLYAAAGAAAQAAPPAGPAEGPWILTCDMPASETGATHRVFRIAPKVFQEWQPGRKTFGNNLCASFPCAADRDRLEGTISSTSVVLTVQVDRRTGGATWRTQGASNLARSTGACTIEKEAVGRPR